MKCYLVLLLIGAMLLAVVKTTIIGRRERQVWSFPTSEPVTTVAAGPLPFGTTSRTTTTRSTAATTTTTTPRPRASTTTRPSGVIFRIECDCPTVQQYNPVCATDGNTYVNNQTLTCARRCGFDVQFARLGMC